ncbi:hypothetical protein EVAR_86194_1 [Eumeta japonica]|uniref:Uncharacterized protein n=1 Tax=Eumeta variegata TaxID=151549 RepID=A0A4C1UBV5_EUMVA|nr:hypothetical protein EVAR_86194_1 [Eumeta japonica]
MFKAHRSSQCARVEVPPSSCVRRATGAGPSIDPTLVGGIECGLASTNDAHADFAVTLSHPPSCEISFISGTVFVCLRLSVCAREILPKRSRDRERWKSGSSLDSHPPDRRRPDLDLKTGIPADADARIRDLFAAAPAATGSVRTRRGSSGASARRRPPADEEYAPALGGPDAAGGTRTPLTRTPWAIGAFG